MAVIANIMADLSGEQHRSKGNISQEPVSAQQYVSSGKVVNRFQDNLCKCWINELADIQVKDIYDRYQIEQTKSKLRDELIERDMIKLDKDIFSKYDNIQIPTCCAIDGSCTLEKSKTGDLILIGATRFNDNESEVIHNKNNNIGFAAYTRHFD